MAGLGKELMVESCINGLDLQDFPSPLLGDFAVPFAERGYRHILFYCASQILNFLKIEGLYIMATLHQPSLLAPFFLTAFNHCVCVSHFGSSHSISNFLLLFYCYYYWKKDYDSLKPQMIISIFEQ